MLTSHNLAVRSQDNVAAIFDVGSKEHIEIKPKCPNKFDNDFPLFKSIMWATLSAPALKTSFLVIITQIFTLFYQCLNILLTSYDNFNVW